MSPGCRLTCGSAHSKTRLKFLMVRPIWAAFFWITDYIIGEAATEMTRPQSLCLQRLCLQGGAPEGKWSA